MLVSDVDYRSVVTDLQLDGRMFEFDVGFELDYGKDSLGLC